MGRWGENFTSSLPHSLFPIRAMNRVLTPLFPNALIIGKKIGKLLTASIIEFDLLFNADASN
ncbi:hypothetical protein A6S26_02545 [Nostoc sp. ATCC 43529]|nr:hypothetical protein A6S26_02545 [Nostoc sp. ATCC 43529]